MKNQKILLICVPILCAIAVIISYIKVTSINVDANKFKNEYEKLNGEKSILDKKYNNLDISKNNPIKYSNYNEIINTIKNGTGIIYLGFPECPWCRSALPVLLEVSKDYNIKTIYYLNIKDERDSYTVEDGKLTYALDSKGNKLKGTKGYFKLLDVLKDELSDYKIEVDSKTYEVGEKRLYAPSVIFVRDGKVLGIQVSTVESQKDAYTSLTKKQKQELYGIYEDYIVELSNSVCSIGSSC